MRCAPVRASAGGFVCFERDSPTLPRRDASPLSNQRRRRYLKRYCIHAHPRSWDVILLYCGSLLWLGFSKVLFERFVLNYVVPPTHPARQPHPPPAPAGARPAAAPKPPGFAPTEPVAYASYYRLFFAHWVSFVYFSRFFLRETTNSVEKKIKREKTHSRFFPLSINTKSRLRSLPRSRASPSAWPRPRPP